MNAFSLHLLIPTPVHLKSSRAASPFFSRASSPSSLRFASPLILRAASSDDSQSVENQTLEVLEWRALCNQLSPFASTTMGLSATKNAEIPVGNSPEESRNLLDETAAALAAMEMIESQRLGLSEIQDLSDIVERAVAGHLLTVRELCSVRSTLMAATSVFQKLRKAAISDKRVTPLVGLVQGCDFKDTLQQKIGFCIDCNMSMILDRASEDLEIIRSERRRNMEKLDSLLKKVSTKIFQAGGIDRPLITQRRSRICVAIRATHKSLLPGGVVLSVSSSRATCYIEPKEAVELNNMEVRHANSEKAEEMAILSILTSEVSTAQKDILHLLDRILELDIAFARASHAKWMNGVYPNVTSEHTKTPGLGGDHKSLSVDIDSAQHPLLLGSVLGSPNDGVIFPVPIDIKVESRAKVVVISGPNTGGKTALLKTLGLISLMSKSGMYLPAKNCPRLPWFDLILADIGDPQSLEQSLSTFSGHISRIRQILDIASENSLVLLDEICSGTDPSEGVALATSILQYIKNRVNVAVVSTHYGDLSRLKDNEPQFQNAAMEFSMETLQPTFRVLWGSTGLSNALRVAKSIGFDKGILENAHKWTEKLNPEQDVERKGSLFQSLVEERNKLKLQASKTAAFHRDLMNLYHELEHESHDLEKRERALLKKETQKVQEDLNSAKSKMQRLVAEFESQLEIVRADQYNSLILKTEEAVAEIIEACCPLDPDSIEEPYSDYSPQAGEKVLVTGLGDKLGTVVEEPGDDETVLVQHGKIRVRIKKKDIKPLPRSTSSQTSNRSLRSKRQINMKELGSVLQMQSEPVRIQTSKNTLDLRGMRAEEAVHQLDMAISGRDSGSILFIRPGHESDIRKFCDI
ncbi:DNA mismatch repair protein MutS C-terminal [Arabidopsis thaliana x Arabidopsis arenosa]|uniref:DNA mismatch repair protein MutS C-terminal n=1 Tax=Arabidopsis thaliana x Arabidopsis arenosa TaxID=1240361 RepID=A0A8T2BHW4_9BRAS|nr:DNA mismatch repair protein MutS C-terminal [Arabidopsis thaliana x Arabidopsis arenosa]